MGKHCSPVRYDDEWVIAHWESVRNWKKLCDEYNRIHGTDVNYSTFKSHCNRCLDLNFHYSEEQIKWLKENYPKLGRIKATEIFNEIFNENKTINAIKKRCHDLGLRVNEERLKARAIENTGRCKAIGELGTGSNGDPYIKTENGWMPVKYSVAGKQHGKILVHLDGNKHNNNKENLMFITRKVSARMIKNKFWSKNPEITKTGIIACELEQSLKEVR